MLRLLVPLPRRLVLRLRLGGVLWWHHRFGELHSGRPGRDLRRLLAHGHFACDLKPTTVQRVRNGREMVSANVSLVRCQENCHTRRFGGHHTRVGRRIGWRGLVVLDQVVQGIASAPRFVLQFAKILGKRMLVVGVRMLESLNQRENALGVRLRLIERHLADDRAGLQHRRHALVHVRRRGHSELWEHLCKRCQHSLVLDGDGLRVRHARMSRCFQSLARHVRLRDNLLCEGQRDIIHRLRLFCRDGRCRGCRLCSYEAARPRHHLFLRHGFALGPLYLTTQLHLGRAGLCLL